MLRTNLHLLTLSTLHAIIRALVWGTPFRTGRGLTSRPLCLNVGFMLHQTVGYNRIFEFDHPSVQVSDDLDVSDLQGELRLTRTAQGLYTSGGMQASTQAECVRCLTPFAQRLVITFDDLFIYPSSRATEPLLAVPETGLLDLSPLAREYMLLAFPLQPLCRPDCRGLCPECGVNWNEADCEHRSIESEARGASRSGSARGRGHMADQQRPGTRVEARQFAKAEFMIPTTPSGKPQERPVAFRRGLPPEPNGRAEGMSRSLPPEPNGRAEGMSRSLPPEPNGRAEG